MPKIGREESIPSLPGGEGVRSGGWVVVVLFLRVGEY